MQVKALTDAMPGVDESCLNLPPPETQKLSSFCLRHLWTEGSVVAVHPQTEHTGSVCQWPQGVVVSTIQQPPPAKRKARPAAPSCF